MFAQRVGEGPVAVGCKILTWGSQKSHLGAAGGKKGHFQPFADRGRRQDFEAIEADDTGFFFVFMENSPKPPWRQQLPLLV